MRQAITAIAVIAVLFTATCGGHQRNGAHDAALTPLSPLVLPSKTASVIPADVRLVARDAGIALSTGGYTLSWKYANTGDYSQDGMVSLDDVEPLAEHFNEAVPADDLASRNTIQAVIDGSGNNRIGIEDITPIAMNWAGEVTGYRIDGAESTEGPWSEIASVELADADASSGRLAFTQEIVAGWTYYRIVTITPDGDAASSDNLIAPSAEPIIYGISPTSGYQHEVYTFTATASGLAPLTYAWDFGGGATPNTSSEVSPTITLSDAGDYSATLTISNSYEPTTFPFTLTATARDMWAHTWGGTRADKAEHILIDDDGNIYCVGYSSSFGVGYEDILVIKYEPSGDLLWVKTWGTENAEKPAGCALVDGGLIVVGDAWNIGAGADDIFFLKYDLDGNLLWARTWGTADYERAAAITTDSQGNIYVAGQWFTYGGMPDVLIAKFTTDATCLWAKRWNGGHKAGAYTVAASPEGGAYICGYIADTGDGPTDALFVEYSALGDFVSASFWDTGESEAINRLLVNQAGSMYATGNIYTPSTGEHVYLLMLLDSARQVVWVKSVPCAGLLASDQAGNLYTGGYRWNAGNPDYCTLVKYSADGEVLWCRKAIGDWRAINTISLNQNEDLFLAGSASSNIGAWESIEEQSLPMVLYTNSHIGEQNELSGVEGIAEGLETTPVGVIDTGASTVNVLLIKNVQ